MNKSQGSTDGYLILQYLEGNTSVLPTLVKRYHQDFCKKAFWITKDKEIAKDIAQDSWISILNKLHTLERLESFKGWASRIVYNKAIDATKLRIKEDKNLEVFRKVETEDQTSEDKNNAKHIALLKAIQKLPKGKQDIIRLFYSESYSINEISTFLNIPIGTVKSRLFKAREKLKSILKNINHEE